MIRICFRKKWETKKTNHFQVQQSQKHRIRTDLYRFAPMHESEKTYREIFKIKSKSDGLAMDEVVKEQCGDEIIEYLFYIKYKSVVKGVDQGYRL
jgi:hypothetical protein